jgi:hypothetical protein
LWWKPVTRPVVRSLFLPQGRRLLAGNLLSVGDSSLPTTTTSTATRPPCRGWRAYARPTPARATRRPAIHQGFVALGIARLPANSITLSAGLKLSCASRGGRGGITAIGTNELSRRHARSICVCSKERQWLHGHRSRACEFFAFYAPRCPRSISMGYLPKHLARIKVPCSFCPRFRLASFFLSYATSTYAFNPLSSSFQNSCPIVAMHAG